MQLSPSLDNHSTYFTRNTAYLYKRLSNKSLSQPAFEVFLKMWAINANSYELTLFLEKLY